MASIISPSDIFNSQAPELKQLPPLGLYIHIPWCVTKCPYCDFNSHQVNGNVDSLEHEYVSRLIRDLEIALPQSGAVKLAVFFLVGERQVYSVLEQLIRY